VFYADLDFLMFLADTKSTISNIYYASSTISIGVEHRQCENISIFLEDKIYSLTLSYISSDSQKKQVYCNPQRHIKLSRIYASVVTVLPNYHNAPMKTSVPGYHNACTEHS
jgi:hypothetical protein